jgi:hypothetical protein
MMIMMVIVKITNILITNKLLYIRTLISYMITLTQRINNYSINMTNSFNKEVIQEWHLEDSQMLKIVKYINLTTRSQCQKKDLKLFKLQEVWGIIKEIQLHIKEKVEMQ